MAAGYLVRPIPTIVWRGERLCLSGYWQGCWRLQFSWEAHRLGSDSPRTTLRQAFTKLTASPVTVRTDVEAQWERVYMPQIFTRSKFNSSLRRSWLTLSLKGEE